MVLTEIYIKAMLNVPLFNAINHHLQMEVTREFYTTVFQLICRMLHDKKQHFFIYSVICKKSSTDYLHLRELITIADLVDEKQIVAFDWLKDSPLSPNNIYVEVRCIDDYQRIQLIN